jgi:SAM-dependent methyltransferase
VFLRHRSRETETFDDLSRPLPEMVKDYAQLTRINRLFRPASPFMRLIEGDGRPGRWRRASVLEIGAGAGELAEELQQWAGRRGWSWEFTCLDLNPAALRLNPLPRKVQGNATQLPFPDGCFDLVIASQMTHHLDDDGVILHFREAWRVTRRAVALSDLHRNLLLLGTVAVCGAIMGLSRRMQADGRLSVRRGFRVGEWMEAARAAGIPLEAVTLLVHFGCRILLWADRDRAATGAIANHPSAAGSCCAHPHRSP